jgi:predicted RND superfamily exporter protein
MVSSVLALQRSSGPGRKTRAFVAFLLRYGKLLWAVAILLAIPATWRTVKLYANLKSDIEELLPRSSPSVVAIDEMRKRNAGLQYLGVVIDTGTADKLPAANRFLDDLAARIRKYPPDLVRTVRVSSTEEREFVEKHAPLYVDLADLKTIRERVEARRDYEVAHATGESLDEDEKPPSIDMSDLEKKYSERIHATGDDKEGDRFASKKQHVALLYIEAGGFSTGADKARVLLDRVKKDVKELDLSKYAPGMKLGYASDIAISVEELEALQTDLSISSVLVIFAVMGVIVAYYRWWKSIPVLIPPLLLAAVYAFALASMPPFRITELNSNTAFLGSIIVGNGINFGLILVARYREERGRGEGIDRALELAIWGARPGTLAAALAAGASYASLIITEFRGFRQFGFIGGLGMLTSWAAAFVLIPPLLSWIDRAPVEKPLPEGSVPPPPDSSRPSLMVERRWSIMRWVARFAASAPATIVFVTIALTVAAGWKVSHFNSSQLEYDFAKLRRYDTWINGEGYWGIKMDKLLGRYVTPTIVMFDTPEEASAAEKRIRDSFEHGSLKRYLADVRGADDVLPKQQKEKIAEAAAIREALTPAVRAAVPKDKLKKLDEILGDKSLRPITLSDLPRSFLTGLRERDGTVGRQVLVFPKPNDFLWQAAAMHEFVETLRDLSKTNGGRPGRVAGSLPLTSDILDSIARDAPIASLASFAGVVLVVLIVLRRSRATAYVIGSLLIGVLWLGGATMALGVKINFANFIAFPITFGIGVDYAVNVIARFEQDGEADVRGAVMSTGGAVGLASCTTIIGYSSLLLAKTRALFYFGLVAVMGEVSCLTTAVVTLPALLLLIQRLRARPRKA